MPVELTEVQRIRTIGARAVEPFCVDGLDLLALPQLARDIPGQPAAMSGGDSNTDLLLLRRENGRYVPWSTLPVPGGEDAEFFTIDSRSFLATASIRTGAGPYDFGTRSVIYSWHDGRFEPCQEVGTFAAKQWRHWSVDGRQFLGLAQGVVEGELEGRNRPSAVYEWNGSRFVAFQDIPSQWGYNWHTMTIDGTFYVAHADHLAPSILYRWNGSRLVRHQQLAERSGRAFASFSRDDGHYLVVACLQAHSRLLKWVGGHFADVQELPGVGGREVKVFRSGGQLFVVRVNFITGERSAPVTALQSQIYEWHSGKLEIAAEFPTTGGTDTAVIAREGQLQLLVSNSLSPEGRFTTDTILYQLSIS